MVFRGVFVVFVFVFVFCNGLGWFLYLIYTVLSMFVGSCLRVYCDGF